jgi:hypothetical protein
MEMLQKENDCDDEKRERVEDERAQAAMMNMFMMAVVGRSLSAEDSPLKTLKEKRKQQEWRRVKKSKYHIKLKLSMFPNVVECISI